MLKLKKSLYALKQSGRNCNDMLHEYLIDEHFEQSLADHCVYTRFTVDSKVIILVWVDDIIIAANDESVLQSVKNSEFEVQNERYWTTIVVSWYTVCVQTRCN